MNYILFRPNCFLYQILIVVCRGISLDLNILERDVNSKFVDKLMSCKRRIDFIISINVKEVQAKMCLVFEPLFINHFANNLKQLTFDQLGVENFKTISGHERGDLIRPFFFCENGVKKEVQKCDGFKSLSPDGINFDFIKNIYIRFRLS